MAVRVRVPGSIANFGPAFDALALAIGVHNELALEPAQEAGVRVEGEGAGVLPTDDTNLVHRAAVAVAERAGVHQTFAVRCRNHIPIGRGLGSSAAAIVGGAVAANAWLGSPLRPDGLLEIAAELEGHPDNAAAALFGGAVVLTKDGAGWAWARLAPAWDAELVVAIPDFTVSTAQARSVLSNRVALADAVANLGRAGLLVAAMLTGRADLLRVAMEDALHQPYRAALIPGMTAVFEAARAAGAFGAALSGSGPAIVAVCPPHLSDGVGAAMVRAFAETGHPSRWLRVEIDRVGAIVV